MVYVPVDDRDREECNTLGPLMRRAPRTQAELIQYVEWAAPRARRLGTRVTKPELRAIGFMHEMWRLTQGKLAREAAEAGAGREHAAAIDGAK